MHFLGVLFTSLLVGLASTAPVKETQNLNDNESLTEDMVIYTAEYDIVNILAPVNGLNSNYSKNLNTNNSTTLIFFVLADYQNGKRVDKGLYVRKDGQVTKLLDNGRNVVADIDPNSKTAYIAASDGIYSYNADENKAEKYGNVTEDIIDIAKIYSLDVLLILTKDHILYAVTDKGTKKHKIPEVDNAKQIVMGFCNTMFYVSNRNVYVIGNSGIKKIKGLPKNWNNIKLLRPKMESQFLDGIPVIVDDNTFVVYRNGTSELAKTELSPNPTAYSVEGPIVQYYGYNKKIYFDNLLEKWWNEAYKHLLDTLADISVEIKKGFKTAEENIKN